MTVEWEKPEGVHLRIKIAEILSNGQAETTDQIASELGRARSTIIQHLARLRKLGIVRYIGPKRGGHWEVRMDKLGGA